MRAAHLVHTFSSLSETFIYNHLQAEKQIGIDCSILTLKRANLVDRPFPEQQIYLLKLSPWDVRRYANRLTAMLLSKNKETANWHLYRTLLRKKLEQLQPDILHAHFGPMGVLAAPVAHQLDIPLVVTFYGYDISELADDPYWQQAYHRLSKRAQAVTVLSNEMRARATKIGFTPQQLRVIHLGIKPDKIQFNTVSNAVQHFISVGRLSGKKGHLDTIKAFREVLQETDQSLHLTIIGGGPMQHELHSYITKKKLQNHINLAGGMPHAEVLKRLSSADAFILNSKTGTDGDMEGTPTVLAEAQAAGLPCISTYHSGIPEMIPTANHRFLAEEGNITQIKTNIQALLNLSAQERKEIAQRGRQKVEKEFSVYNEAIKFKNLYQQFL